jgi:hypothetical protein
MPPKPPNLLQARLLLSAALHSAAARLEITDEPEDLINLLAPTIEEIEQEARELRSETEQLRQAHAAERAQWQTELAVQTKLRNQAERDATAVANTPQVGPLENPIGYYVYYLWGYGDRLLYIGMSTNILHRLGQHLTNPDRRDQICRIVTIGCPDEAAMRRSEAAAIRQHRPEWNIAGVPA